VHPHAQLTQVIHTRRAAGLVPGPGQGRQQQRRPARDDSNHAQQLDAEQQAHRRKSTCPPISYSPAIHLFYLLDDLAEVVAVDINPRQNALLELKLALIRRGFRRHAFGLVSPLDVAEPRQVGRSPGFSPQAALPLLQRGGAKGLRRGLEILPFPGNEPPGVLRLTPVQNRLRYPPSIAILPFPNSTMAQVQFEPGPVVDTPFSAGLSQGMRRRQEPVRSGAIIILRQMEKHGKTK
jgi:hypothetical protein